MGFISPRIGFDSQPRNHAVTALHECTVQESVTKRVNSKADVLFRITLFWHNGCATVFDTVYRGSSPLSSTMGLWYNEITSVLQSDNKGLIPFLSTKRGNSKSYFDNF